MKSTFISTIGKSAFIMNYPILFSLIVVIGSDLTLLVFRESNVLLLFTGNSIKAIGTLAIKLIVMLIFSYAFIYFKKRTARKLSS